MTHEKIFDIENVEDISKKCKETLKVSRKFIYQTLILDLFKIKKRLTTDEMIVALYRLHNIEKPRSWIVATRTRLVKNNLIKKVSKNEYELVL